MTIVVLFIIISVFIIVVIIIIIYDTNRWKIFEIIQLSLKSNHPTWCSTANFNHRSSDVKLYWRATKLVLSNIPLDWYSSNIFSTNPYSSNIFSTNPYSSNIFSTNPYSSNILSCKFHIIYTTNVYTLFAPTICHNTPPEVRCTGDNFFDLNQKFYAISPIPWAVNVSTFTFITRLTTSLHTFK